MQNMMLLVIITDLNLGAKGKPSGVSCYDSIENFQNCSLASAIVSNQSHTLSALDLKINIGK